MWFMLPNLIRIIHNFEKDGYVKNAVWNFVAVIPYSKKNGEEREKSQEGNMSGKGCGKGGTQKHTPIVSRAQRGKFGAELKRRRTGKKAQMPGITTKELSSHLKESGGKKLPARTTGRKRGKTKRRK